MNTNFNSIKVRLKPKQQAKNQEIRKFQFHKGTIKTCFFHLLSRLLNYFNSIKVRLKLAKLLAEMAGVPNFNSIKVRLKQVYQGSGWMLLHPFQFHKGTIKTLERQ